jgi:hypothetical protein
MTRRANPYVRPDAAMAFLREWWKVNIMPREDAPKGPSGLPSFRAWAREQGLLGPEDHGTAWDDRRVGRAGHMLSRLRDGFEERD